MSSKPPFVSFISLLIIYGTLASVLLDKINHNKLNHVMTHSPEFQTYALPKSRADPFMRRSPCTTRMGESMHTHSLYCAMDSSSNDEVTANYFLEIRSLQKPWLIISGYLSKKTMIHSKIHTHSLQH